MKSANPTAAVLLIGDEILSGRTKDANLAYIAEFLGALGIDVKEARVVSDVEAEIVAALNALRERYTYVFTTGGIGPTHDDITADSVAAAFGVGISHHPEAVEVMRQLIRERGLEENEARMRMARVPHGAELIANPVSKAPGFHIGNVFVMAGIPRVMQAMMDNIAPKLTGGERLQQASVQLRRGEGDAAAGLGEIQRQFPDVMIGSYPFEAKGGFGTNIVLRSRNKDALEAARQEVEKLVEKLPPKF
jgi:molybdenum cofactor synthesis domain-containing protein